MEATPKVIMVRHAQPPPRPPQDPMVEIISSINNPRLSFGLLSCFILVQ